jgi:hypothetical protein
MTEQAQCPECEEWFPVAWDASVPPGGMWWVDSAGCPGCDALVCVESECMFRPEPEWPGWPLELGGEGGA